MKRDKIIEVLKDHVNINGYIYQYDIEAIADELEQQKCYPEEFVEWCIETVDIEEREEVDYCYSTWYKGNVFGFDTLPELYDYWLTNIKDK